MARLTSVMVAFGLIAIGLVAAPSTATVGGENGQIAFTRVSDDTIEIFRADPDGSNVEKLTSSKPARAGSFEPDWSPDGRTISFDSDRIDAQGRKHAVQIYVMRPDGSGVTQLTRGPGFHAEAGWSPSGTSLAINSDWGKRSLRGIWIIPASDPNGVTVEDARRVTEVPDRAEFDGEPQFSPDGRTIVFTRFKSFERSRSAIFRVNSDGSGLERLTNYRLNASYPNVSPDGKWVAFDSGDTGAPGTKGDIYIRRLDGSGRKRALTDRPRREENGPFDLAQNPVFSPNGKRILYTQFRSESSELESSELMVMKTNGSDKHSILGGRRIPNRGDWGTHR